MADDYSLSQTLSKTLTFNQSVTAAAATTTYTVSSSLATSAAGMSTPKSTHGDRASLGASSPTVASSTHQIPTNAPTREASAISTAQGAISPLPAVGKQTQTEVITI
jgi:hypothetical protein